METIYSTDDAKWEQFIVDSPQETIFCSPMFLRTLENNRKYCYVTHKDKILVGALLSTFGEGNAISPSPYTMYQGVLCSSFLDHQPPHSKYPLLLHALELLLEELCKNYSSITFCLHHTFPDVRAFSWFNYHSPENGVFRVDARYTAVLKKNAITSIQDNAGDFRDTRRQEIKRAQKLGLSVESSGDIAAFLRLYESTFSRQNLTACDISLVEKISKAAIKGGYGDLLLCRNVDGKPLSATLFLFDKHCGYYLFSANDPVHRNTGSGTFLMAKNIENCLSKNKEMIDFVGVNSPNRGDFKISFNGEPKLYFLVSWNIPTAGKVIP